MTSEGLSQQDVFDEFSVQVTDATDTGNFTAEVNAIAAEESVTVLESVAVTSVEVVNTFPTASPVNSGESTYNTRTKLMSGIIVGGGVITLVLYTEGFTAFKNVDIHYLQATGLPAVLLAVVAIALVAAWATRNSLTGIDSAGFLGSLTWSDNALAWHIVLAVGGFFAAQVFAINTWGLISNHLAAKILHFLWHTAGLVAMGVSLAAIKHFKDDVGSENFGSMHSLLGVMAATMFSLNYLYGAGMALMKMCSEQKPSSATNIRTTHMGIGLMAFGITTAAILTGEIC